MKYSFPLGISLGVYPAEEIFFSCADAGIRFIELSPREGDLERLFSEAEGVKAMAERAGVTIRSLHLPFGDRKMNFCAPDEAEREATLRVQRRLLHLAAALGAKYAIAHGGIPYPQAERKKYLSIARDNLAALQADASALGLHICVESLLPSCIGRNSEELLFILSAHPDLRACFDPNHLFGESHEGLLLALGDRVSAVHFSDYDGLDERHWMPGEGVIDWSAVVATLEKIGYGGPLLYEVNPFKTPATIERRPLTFRDYAQNHAALCRGEIPAPIGKPIEKECLACVFAERYFKNFGVKYEPKP